MYRSPPLEFKELMALYGSDGNSYPAGDEDYTSEDYDLDSESSEEAKGGRGIRSSVSLEIYGLQREQHVSFSNQEYYRRLEELKSTHLRNMAELERMYISQGRERCGEGDEGGLRRGRNREARQSVSGAVRKLQRINSQEELDFHETSSGSDQSELCGEDSMGDLELNNPRRTLGPARTFTRDVLLRPDERTTQKQFRFQPKSTRPQPHSGLSRQAGVRVWSSSKVTVPKPFKMMLREEERKKQRVRTRSEIELENTLLRRELEELRECQKQFRASPAPAHIHLPLYTLISCRPSQRPGWSRASGARSNQASAAAPAASLQPFHFLERERKKREARIVAELGNLGHKEERRAFRARPMPSSVYGKRHRTKSKSSQQPECLTTSSLEREATEGQSDPNSDLEPDTSQSDPCTAFRGPGRYPSTKPVKKQIELSIEMVQEREWSYVNPV